MVRCAQNLAYILREAEQEQNQARGNGRGIEEDEASTMEGGHGLDGLLLVLVVVQVQLQHNLLHPSEIA
jgi:hypothetical protein